MSTPIENNTIKLTGVNNTLINYFSPEVEKNLTIDYGDYWVQVTTQDIFNIQYYNGIYLGQNRSSYDRIEYSYDLQTWNTVSFNGNYSKHNHFLSLINGVWVAATYYNASYGVYYSEDGVTWTLAITAYISSIYNVNNTIFMTANGNNAYCSTDGINWTLISVALSELDIAEGHMLYFSGNKPIYINNQWMITSYNSIYTSTDGLTWLAISDHGVSNGTHLQYINGIYYIGSSGDYGLYYSTDGVSWTITSVEDTTSVDMGMHTQDIKYFNNQFFIYGAWGGENYYSSDGINWYYCMQDEDILYDQLYKIFYINNTFIGMAQNGLYISSNGDNWTLLNVPYDEELGYLTCNDILIFNETSLLLLSDNGIQKASLNDLNSWKILAPYYPLFFEEVNGQLLATGADIYKILDVMSMIEN